MHSPVLCDIYITQIARIEFSFHTSLFLLLVYHTCLTYKVSITLKVFFSFSQSHMPTSNQEIAHHLCAPPLSPRNICAPRDERPRTQLLH